MGRLLAFLALCWAFAAPVGAMTPAQYLLLITNPKVGGGPGQPMALACSDTIWTSSTDLTPISQYVNGWTCDLTFKTTTPAGLTSAYTPGTQSAPGLSFVDTSPGYNSSAGVTTVNRTIYATSWLRQTYNNATLPTEAANSGNVKTAWTLNDAIYSGDTLGNATALSGLYVSGAVTSRASTSIPVANNSTRLYERPIGMWVTPPGLRYDGSASATVEFFAGHRFAQGTVPVAAVVFTATDGTHSVSHTVSTMAQSTRLLSWSCTGTNGSATLTSCGDTSGAILNQRFTVPGIPGQPKLLSKTSTSLTFGQTTTCTPTLLGAETISTTPGAGEALGDGAFAGASITDAHLTTSPATIVVPTGTGSTVGSSTTLTLGAPASGQWAVGMFITGTNLGNGNRISALGTGTGGAGTYTIAGASTGTVSGTVTGSAIAAQPTAATTTTISIPTSSSVGTASSGSCTINHVYQGSTGPVTATAGVPVPVYQGVFSTSDLATLTDGIITFRAQVYPIVGNVVLDTQTGADGTQCDWFFPNVNGGNCNSSSAAWFAVNGTNNSANLHNLWAYKDANLSYNPAYVWVESTGTCTTSACVSTSNAEPTEGTAGNFAATTFQAVTNLKSFYNTRTLTGSQVNHNDAAGGIVCITATGSPFSGFGGNISALSVANVPALTLTSAANSGGGTCPATGAVGSNTAVTLGHNATATNLLVPPFIVVNNLSISDTATVLQGADVTSSTVFPTQLAIFNGDIITPTANNAALLYKIGNMRYYNGYVNEAAGEGDVFTPLSVTQSYHVFGTTAVLGTYTAVKAAWWLYAALGNVSWGGTLTTPTGTASAAYNQQPISTVAMFNKFMGLLNPPTFGNGQVPISNVLEGNNVIERINDASEQAGLVLTGDNNNVPSSNWVRFYDSVIGARTNEQYVEGNPLLPTVVASGGSLPAATYFFQITYALKGNPTVPTSTDGPTPGIVVGGTGTDSLTLALLNDPNYVYYLYVDTANPPVHFATVAAADAKQLAGNQTVTITAIGGAGTPITTAATTGHNEFKDAFFNRFNIENNFNMKTDTYSGATEIATGGRVGNWQGRWRVGWIGNVMVTGTQINGPGPAPTSGLGEILNWLETYNPNGDSDLSLVQYMSDRSFGSFATLPTYPALNLGEGNYCPNTSTVTTPLSRVPSGLAAYPFDIQGRARLNDGTGAAGAYEQGCL